MTSTDILIPFGLPPPEHAKDLVATLTSECKTDGLATLLSRHQSRILTRFDDFTPQLPHEVWLNARLHTAQSSLLQQYAHLFNINLNPGHWFLVTPVHLHIARNHLVLTDYRDLHLSESDSFLLYEIAKTRCNEAGAELVFGSATIWFLRTDNWSDFVTSSPDAACGHNIEVWSAKGANEFAWRKLQNDIQMEWFIHPVQKQREEHGEKVINGLWLWSGTSLPTGFSANNSIDISMAQPYLSPSPTDGREKHSSEHFFPALPELTLLDQLSSAALSNDWGTWLALVIELENSWFKPLCTALKSRKLDQLQLHLSNNNTLLSIRTNNNALRKFWRTPTFKQLIT
jgi:hypothetical protein